MLAIRVENLNDLAIIECKGRIVRSDSVFKLRDVVREQAEAASSRSIFPQWRRSARGPGMLAFLDHWAHDTIFSSSYSALQISSRGLMSNRSILISRLQLPRNDGHPG